MQFHINLGSYFNPCMISLCNECMILYWDVTGIYCVYLYDKCHMGYELFNEFGSFILRDFIYRNEFVHKKGTKGLRGTKFILSFFGLECGTIKSNLCASKGMLWNLCAPQKGMLWNLFLFISWYHCV